MLYVCLSLYRPYVLLLMCVFNFLCVYISFTSLSLSYNGAAENAGHEKAKQKTSSEAANVWVDVILMNSNLAYAIST